MTRRHSHGFWLTVVALMAFFAFCGGHIIGAAKEWHACKTVTSTLGVRG